MNFHNCLLLRLDKDSNQNNEAERNMCAQSKPSTMHCDVISIRRSPPANYSYSLFGFWFADFVRISSQVLGANKRNSSITAAGMAALKPKTYV